MPVTPSFPSSWTIIDPGDVSPSDMLTFVVQTGYNLQPQRTNMPLPQHMGRSRKAAAIKGNLCDTRPTWRYDYQAREQGYKQMRSTQLAAKIHGWLMAKFAAMYGRDAHDEWPHRVLDRRLLPLVEEAWRKWPHSTAWEKMYYGDMGTDPISISNKSYPIAVVGTVIDPYQGHSISTPWGVPPNQLERERAAGHYVERIGNNLYYTIARVPPGEWARWRVDGEVIVVSGYKQFAASGGIVPPFMRNNVASYRGKMFAGSPESSIASYHNAQQQGYRAIGSVDDSTTIGAEIEIVPRHDTALAASSILADFGDWLDVERDGSVESGFEIVTGFGSLDALSERVRELYRKHLASHNRAFRTNRSTGLHFHVGNKNLSSHAVYTLLFLLESCRPLTTAIAGRAPNRYCVFPMYYRSKENYLSAMRTGVFEFSDTRYAHVNVRAFSLNGQRRVEWRAPHSTVSYANWRARAEFIVHALDYALHTAPLVTTAKHDAPSYNDFLKYMADLPADKTVGIRRVLASSAVKNVMAQNGIVNPMHYNGRSEFALLNA